MLPSDQPVPLTCPTCGGILTLHPSTNTYCCTLGHDFLPEQLAAASEKDLIRTLWTCLRQVEERQWLLAQLAARTDMDTATAADLQAVTHQLRTWLQAEPTAEEAHSVL